MIHHISYEKLVVAEVVQEQVGVLCGQGGAADAARGYSDGKHADATPAPDVVLRVADDDDVFAGVGAAGMGVGTLDGDRRQFGAVGVVAAEGAEGKVPGQAESAAPPWPHRTPTCSWTCLGVKVFMLIFLTQTP